MEIEFPFGGDYRSSRRGGSVEELRSVGESCSAGGRVILAHKDFPG